MRYIILLALFVSGCATSSGVLPMGPDTYTVSKEGGSALNSVASLKADVFRDANEYCAKAGRQIRVTNTADTPAGFMRFPRSEVTFMCLNKGDPELTRPKMERDADTKVEVRTPATNR